MGAGTRPDRSGTTRSWSARFRSDRGALAIEMVLLLPLAFTLMFLAVQGAVYYHGRSVALAAAQEGARGAAAYEASNADGRQAALSFTDHLGGTGTLDDPTVTVERDPDVGKVTVEVTGTTMSLVPGWEPEVTQSASRPVQEFTAPEDSVGLGGFEDDDPDRGTF